MLFLRLLMLFAIWLLFSAAVIWLLGISPCRNSARWYREDKIQKYIEISSPRLAGLVIPGYIGHSSFVSTNIPALYDQYEVNAYPSRLSVIGLADYCVTGVLCVWYEVCMTAYFLTGGAANPTVPIILLMARLVIFAILHGWNRSRVRLDQVERITKAEMKRRKKTL